MNTQAEDPDGRRPKTLLAYEYSAYCCFWYGVVNGRTLAAYNVTLAALAASRPNATYLEPQPPLVSPGATQGGSKRPAA